MKGFFYATTATLLGLALLFLALVANDHRRGLRAPDAKSETVVKKHRILQETVVPKLGTELSWL